MARSDHPVLDFGNKGPRRIGQTRHTGYASLHRPGPAATLGLGGTGNDAQGDDIYAPPADDSSDELASTKVINEKDESPSSEDEYLRRKARRRLQDSNGLRTANGAASSQRTSLKRSAENSEDEDELPSSFKENTKQKGGRMGYGKKAQVENFHKSKKPMKKREGDEDKRSPLVTERNGFRQVNSAAIVANGKLITFSLRSSLVTTRSSQAIQVIITRDA